jgi:transposase-like protein/IS1 family transposase
MNCNHVRNRKDGSTKVGTQRYRCCDCGKRFTESTSTLGGMRIGVEKSAQIVHCMMEGVGVRGTARLAGICPNTVLDTLVLVGQRCKAFTEGELVGVPVKDVQCDELWSYVGMKERTRKLNSLPVGIVGDSYCFVGLERNHKLALAWHMGDRTHENGVAFVRKLARACSQDERLQISTDGWMAYKHLIPNHFRGADYGMIIKIFGASHDSGRYSPAAIIETKRKTIKGSPDESRINTSHVERHNLTMRMQLRRFTRLTNGFSRKHANHEAALGLYFAHYNYVQKHGTIRTTPAVAAGLTDKPWTAAELIERTADYNPPRRTGDWQKFLDILPD